MMLKEQPISFDEKKGGNIIRIDSYGNFVNLSLLMPNHPPLSEDREGGAS